MRITAPTSAFEDRIAALVHSSAAGDHEERERHIRFMLSRLMAGCACMAALPVYLAVFGALDMVETTIFVLLALPVLAVVVLSRTGRLAWAYAISSASMSGLILTLAISSGGMASPIILWFVAVPLEATFSGSARAVRITMISAILGLLAVGAAEILGLAAPTGNWSIQVAVPVVALTAIVHATAVGLAICRTDVVRRTALMVRDARDQAVLEAIGDCVTWHDLNGNVSFASDVTEKLVGCSPRHLLGRGLFDRVQVADRPAYVKALADVAHGEGPVTVEIRVACLRPEAGPDSDKRLSTQYVWMEFKAHLIRPPAEQPMIVAVMRDIDQRKRHEEYVESAREEAERANEMKGRFLATVSHELRTPLNAIIGFSEILGNASIGPLDEERRQEYARIIHTSGHHLLEVVNTLLNVSKIESGNFDINPEPFDLCELAYSCCDLMRLKAQEAQITLEHDFGADVPDIVADRRACKQVLINLLSNAVKFTPPHGTIKVSLHRREMNVVLSVQDTGIGIAETDLPNIGDPFFQARSSYDRPYEGTGLGLSVVRGLVGLHHGSIRIESAVRMGTTVTVTLPLDCRSNPIFRATPIEIETRVRRGETDQITHLKKTA